MDAIGTDVYVYNNLNIHGGLFFHQNIVDGIPGGSEYGISFGLITGTGTFSGKGVVYLDNGETHLYSSERLRLPALLAVPFDAYVQAYLSSLVGKTGHYNVLTNNCRDFSQSQFRKIKKMYNQFLQNNYFLIQDIMNMQQDNMLLGGGEFTV